MKVKFYLLAALLGALAIFIWGAFAHMALPWWEDVLQVMPNEQPVVDVLKANGMQNGMYYGMQGIFLVTFFGKGMTDGAGMAGPMVFEFISDMALALLLAWLLLRADIRGISRAGVFAGVVGLAGWLAANVSTWIWYNFSCGYVMLEAVEQVPGTFLAGLVIGWLLQKQRTTVSV